MAERALPDLRARVRVDDTDLPRAAARAKAFGRDVEGSVGAAHTRLSALGHAFGAVGAGVASLVPIGVALGVGMAGAAVGMGALGLKAIQSASQMEQSKIAFATMLGSAQQADAFLKQLFTFASTTPFTFVGLQQSAKQLLAYGFQAQQIIPIMTAIGDSVAALGGGEEVLNRVTVALGQIQAKGKISAEEMRQLAEAGIPAWQFLAEAIGTDIPTAMAKAEAGTISAAVGIEAITSGMERRFGGLMQKQSQTIAGLWSNVQDTVEMTLVSIGTRLVTTFDLKTKLAGVLTFLQQLGGLMEGRLTLSQVVGPEAAASLERLGKVANDVGQAIGAIAKAVEPAAAALGRLIMPHIDVVIIFAATAAIGLMTAAVIGLAVALSPITLIALAVVVVIAALAAAAYLIYTNWGPISSFFIGLWNQVVAATLGAWNVIWGAITGFIGGIVGAIGGFFSSLGAMASAAWAEFARHPFYWIGYIAVFVPLKLFELYNAFLGWVASMIVAVVGWAIGMQAQASIAAAGFVLAASAWFSSLPGRVAGFLAGVIGAAASFAAQLPGWAFAAGRDFTNALIRELQALPGQVYGIGVAVVNGIVGGIRDAAWRLYSAAREVVEGALNAAKDALGIRSPSRIFALEIGLPSVQGIVAGIEQGLPALQVAVDKLKPAPAAAGSEALLRPAFALAAAGERPMHNITINGAVMQPLDERRLIGLLREMDFLYG